MHNLLGDVFCGVWSSDHLSLLNSTFKPPAYFIVNTHPSHMPGEHWLALTLEKDGKATFFDSYGLPPDFDHFPKTILQFLKERSQGIKYHNMQLQHHLSAVCGHHCVYYLSHRACGLSFEQMLSLYDQDVIKNDLMVYDYVKKYQHCIRNKLNCASKQGNCCFISFH